MGRQQIVCFGCGYDAEEFLNLYKDKVDLSISWIMAQSRRTHSLGYIIDINRMQDSAKDSIL